MREGSVKRMAILRFRGLRLPYAMTMSFACACFAACTAKAPDVVETQSFVNQRIAHIHVSLPTNIEAGTKGAKTFVYWNTVAKIFEICEAWRTAPNSPYGPYDGPYLSKPVLNGIGSVAVSGVDEDAVTAITTLLSVDAESAKAERNNLAGSLSKTGSDIQPGMTAANNGEFGSSVSAAAAGMSNAAQEAVATINANDAIRANADIRLEAARRLLEARYGNAYQRIAIGTNSCMTKAAPVNLLGLSKP